MSQFLQGLIRSRSLKIFFVVAIVLHLLFGVALVVSEDLRKFVFNTGSTEVVKTDATPAEIQRAMNQLIEIFKKKLDAAAERLYVIREKMGEIEKARLKTIREGDAKRVDGAKIAAEIEAKTRKLAQGEVKPGDLRHPDPDLWNLSIRIDAEPTPVEISQPFDYVPMDFPTTYRILPGLEAECGRLYERYRALELADHYEQPLPLSAAINAAKLALPQRREIDESKLNQVITTLLDGKFDEFRGELVACYLEAEDMVANADKWYSMILKREASNLDAAGTQVDIVPDPSPYFGHYLDPNLLERRNLTPLIKPKVVLGNKIAEVGTLPPNTEWISIDRWYYIGPFVHPGKERKLSDLERKYGPEASPGDVDLDTTYVGRDGVKLRWKYRRFSTNFLENGIRLEPYVADNTQYCVWYFYTEINSESEQDVLASFCSDDYGVCWVNGQRVYTSPPTTQPWVPFTENSFKIVKLKKGINKFMFKLENALGTTGFAALLMTHSDKDLLAAFRGN